MAQYLRRELEKTGARVREQTYEVHSDTYRNIVAELGPTEGERVVIGAHYDTCMPLPGADDNASGVAGLLELARLLAKEKLSNPVELVAFTLEEPPFFRTPNMGSAVHAKSLAKANTRVRLMVAIEMIGYFSDAPKSQHFPLSALGYVYPTTGNFIAVVGALGEGALVRRVKSAMRGASTLPVHSINAPRAIPGIDLSDHASYWDAGFPAVMVTDTAFYRNANYHRETDTPETLDYRRMAMVVSGLRNVALAFANELP